MKKTVKFWCAQAKENLKNRDSVFSYEDNILEKLVLPSLVYRVSAISVKTWAGYFLCIYKLILRFMQGERPRRANMLLKKNKL